jgi:hypothetical protein
MREAALASKQETAELGFERLDAARQRRLRYVALLGGTREVQRFANCKKIADLIHLHGRSSDSR